MSVNREEILSREVRDKNCEFYLKTGACRHGDSCQKSHVIPKYSRTVLLKNFYLNPSYQQGVDNQILYNYDIVSREEVQDHFDNFYEDVFVECEQKYGTIISMNVCDNINDHLTGNVYIKFKSERAARTAVSSLNNRWFGGKPIYAELSPVTDLSRAFCIQNKFGTCPKGLFCNFMHVKRVSPAIEQYLYGKTSKRLYSHDKQRISPNSCFDSLQYNRLPSKLNDSTSRNRSKRKSRSSSSNGRKSRSCSSNRRKSRSSSSNRRTSRSCSSNRRKSRSSSSNRRKSRSSSSNRRTSRSCSSNRRTSRSCSSNRRKS